LPELPYDEVTDGFYSATATTTFTAFEAGPGTVQLTGPCPRCGTVIEVSVVSGIYKSVRRLRRTQPRPPPATRVAPVICTCVDDHPGRPEGKVGCGAYWLLSLTTP
jgi:hypothetical protein